jgi:hypothetical protein
VIGIVQTSEQEAGAKKEICAADVYSGTTRLSVPGKTKGGIMTCESYCSHGGVCSLASRHDGKHSSSGYCTWTDDEAVSKAESDATYRAKLATRNLPEEILDMENILRELAK